MKTIENNCVITNLRGSKLGVIRLSKMAYAREEDYEIKIGDLEVKPVGFDTYGHPVISEKQFEIYKNMKALMEQQNKVLKVEVSYCEMAFCIKTCIFDTIAGIEDAISASIKDKNLRAFKEMLVYRKQYAFSGGKLHEFVVFGKYLLAENGKVYNVKNMRFKDIPCDAEKEDRPDLRDTVSIEELSEIEAFEEVHIPNVGEKCAICGKELTLIDVVNCTFMENDSAEKAHTECFDYYNDCVNWQKANEIVSVVYGNFRTEKMTEIIDDEDGVKEVERYLYHTVDGDISIRIKTKVIEIKWHGKFKPFDFDEVFENEEVTKMNEKNFKIIHAWSKDKAIDYLLRAKFAK